ncbi:MAG: APC family permease, partial [Halobacteriales archaeon]|nr:APC family permease [Halobacteriales archaeon]
AILLFAIGVAFSLFDGANFSHLLPCYNTLTGVPCYAPGFDAAAPTYDVTGFGDAVKAVMAAAAIMFFAYIGFDSVSTTAEETKNPKRDLPIGILGSLGISTLLYILAAGALVGASHWSEFVGPSATAQAAVGEPFGYVFETHHRLDVTVNGAPFSLGALLVRLGAFIGTTSVLLVLILGGVRVFFNMSRDGLLPAWMSAIGRRGNPATTTWIYGAFTLVLAGLLTLGAAVELVNIGTLFAFFMVILATWIFRRKRPDVERPFRMPALAVLAVLGMVGTLGLIVSLDAFTLMASVTWAGIGLLIYALYGVRHSREAAERMEALTPRPKVRPVTSALGKED